MYDADDQIVPIDVSAELSLKLLKNGTLKVYKGFSLATLTDSTDVINPDLLAFAEG